MRARLLALLPMVVLLALFLPAGGVASAETVIDTVVDEVDELSAPDGRRAESLQGISEQTPTPIRFSMVAFTAPPGAEVSYRTSVDGATWTAWRHAEPPDGQGPDGGTGEAMRAEPDHRRSGEPTWVGDARWLQAKVAGAPLDEVSADVIDSMGLSRSLWKRAADAVRTAWRGKGTAVAQAGGQPAIVSRSQWGADESLRTGSPDSAAQARYGVLHHTAGTNTYTAAQAPGIVRGIYAFHTKSRGWSDIGYNFLVDRFGTIYEGRAGGIDKAVIGAHALGFNTSAIGVSLMGNHDAGAVSSAARTAVTRLLAWKFALHGIDPNATVRIVSACSGSCKHPAGKVLNLPGLFSHRDVGYTTCPGGSGHDALPGLRKAIAARQVDVGLSSPPFTDDDRSVHAQGILRLHELGIAKGCTATEFCPTEVVSREQMASFLSRTLSHLDRPQPAVDQDYFADDDGSVHEPAINTLTAGGVTAGCSDSSFCPRQAVRRGDVAEWIARALELEAQGTDHFSDDDGKSYEWAINALADADLTHGCAADRYCDGAETSRGQMASFLARTISLVEAQ